MPHNHEESKSVNYKIQAEIPARPTPNHLILPAILAEIAQVLKLNIILFDAIGLHRQNTQDELRFTLGDERVDDYRVVQNDAFDESSQ